MGIKFIHPLWTHFPALIALLAGVVFTLISLPLPDPAPLHFTWDGQPDKYGTPWVSMIWQAGLSLLYIILSLVIDEAWARQERQKTFNWLALLDDVVVVAMATIQITYIIMLTSGNYIYPFPWVITLVVIALAAGIAILLEKMRPYNRYESSLAIEDISQVKSEVSRIVKSGQPLAYWEVQNPGYSKALAIAIPLLMVIVAVTAWSEVPWLSVLLALVGLAMASIYGGFRTLVTKDLITLRMGILGIQLLKIETSEIVSSELHSFQPLKDFGGYGIRFNKEMKAYYLRGNHGVKITTRSGKKILIGSDHSERLEAVISAVMNQR